MGVGILVQCIRSIGYKWGTKYTHRVVPSCTSRGDTRAPPFATWSTTVFILLQGPWNARYCKQSGNSQKLLRTSLETRRSAAMKVTRLRPVGAGRDLRGVRESGATSQPPKLECAACAANTAAVALNDSLQDWKANAVSDR